jgi:3-phosphoshikimate 1-carboxyvinyltransferase
MSDPLARRLIVIGLGLIGGSLAKAAKERGLVSQVIGINRSADSLEYALNAGVIDQAFQSVEEALADCTDQDIILLGVPVLSMGPVLQKVHDHLMVDATITDVGSAKSILVEQAKSIWSEMPSNLVLGHPIAGSEKFGVQAADATLFENHRVILTPTGAESDNHLQRVRQLWTGVGAEVDEMSAEHHDKILAATSHLPHILAFTLVDQLASMEEQTEVLRYAAGGFRDFSRIAGSDPIMWRDILIANRESIISRIDEFETHLEKLKVALGNSSPEQIQEIFERAQKTRNGFLHKSDENL